MNLIYHKIEVEDVRTILLHKYFEYSNENLERYRDEIAYPIPGRIGPLQVIAQTPNRIVVKGSLHAFCIWAAKIKGHSEQEFSPFRLIEAVWMLRDIIGEEIGDAIAEDFLQAAMGYKVYYKGQEYITFEQACELRECTGMLQDEIRNGSIEEYEIYDQKFYRVEDVLGLGPILDDTGEGRKNTRRSSTCIQGI